MSGKEVIRTEVKEENIKKTSKVWECHMKLRKAEREGGL